MGDIRTYVHTYTYIHTCAVAWLVAAEVLDLEVSVFGKVSGEHLYSFRCPPQATVMELKRLIMDRTVP